MSNIAFQPERGERDVAFPPVPRFHGGPVRRLQFRVHQHLRTSAELVSLLRAAGLNDFDVHFVDLPDGDKLDDNGHPVVVPAMNEVQAELIRRLREDGGCSLSPVVAVVHDYSGHQTYAAMRSGASSVVNLAIPVGGQIPALRALFVAVPACRLVRCPDTEPDARPVEPAPPTRLPDDETEALVRLLCTGETISAIARRFYCSERTMYRRIRTLYDELGVSGRTQLRMVMAARREAS